jgi:hypothetical protein
MRETLKHQQAFEYYYMLGPERSLGKVASQFNISRPTATMWSQKLNWDERIIERDRENMREVREQNNEDVKNQMEAYRKIIKASVSDYIKRLKDNKVKIDSVNDFTKLVKLDMELCGYIERTFNDETNTDTDNDTSIIFEFDDKNKQVVTEDEESQLE